MSGLAEATQIIEFDIERDRKTCVSLFHKVNGANRELAQWLLDHPRYTGEQVAGWLGCGKSKILDLRQWAKEGFEKTPSEKRRERANKLRMSGKQPLNSQENSPYPSESDEPDDGGDGVAPPEEIRENILDTIDRHAAVVRSYKKVLRVSSLDQSTKDEVSNAISVLITVWQSLQRALRPKGEVK